MKTGQLLLVSAPSGAGKTSLVQAALARDSRLVASVSHTTRASRGDEVDGVNYHFVSTDEFNAMIKRDQFLEHAQVFDHQYGTAKAQVEALRNQGRDVILEIDWQGADQVRELMPDAVSLFILPPSLAVLKERLESRGQDSPQSIKRRLAEAQLEMSQAPRYEYIVVNDDFDQTLNDVLAVFQAARLSSKAQIEGDEAVQAILSV